MRTLPVRPSQEEACGLTHDIKMLMGEISRPKQYRQRRTREVTECISGSTGGRKEFSAERPQRGTYSQEGNLTSSGVRQGTTTVHNRDGGVGARLRRPLRGMSRRTSTWTGNIKRSMNHTAIAGSQRKAVDEDERQLQLTPTSMGPRDGPNRRMI